MEFRILGPMEVLDGSRRVDLPSGHIRALLALLVLHPGVAVSADRLIDEIWGEHPPATASTVVQGLVSKLRRRLEPSRSRGQPGSIVQTTGNGYCLAIDPGSVDADRFKRLVDQANLQPPDLRSALLTEALALWRGPALAEFAYEPFAQRAIAALDELRLGAVEAKLDAALESGRHHELIAELSELVEDHPFRERLRCLQIVALYRDGRQVEALEAFRRGRDRLVEELGVEPGPELRALEAAVLRQDPSLDLVRTTPRAPGPGGWLPRERRTVTS